MSEETTPPQQPSRVTSTVVRSVVQEQGDPPIPVASFISWVQHGIFAIFGVGFVAWAVVVWNAADLAKTQAAEMVGLREDIQELKNWQETRNNLWSQQYSINSKADTEIANLQSQMDRRFDELAHDIDELRDRKK